MKKLLLSLILIAGFFSLQAKDGYEVTFNQLNETTSELQFTLGDFDFRNVNLSGTDFTKIIFDGSVVTKDKGFAELPFINANVQLGADNNVALEFVGEEFTDYQLEFPLVPSRGVIYRDQDPSQVPYEIAAGSMVDAFFPTSLADVTDAYIIKDVRGTTVYVYPFQYNAVTQTLRVYTNLTVQLSNDNSTPVNPLYNTSGKVYREMEGLYKSVFVNYQPAFSDDLTVGEAGDILVITTARDENAIQPYIDWKMEKGYEVFKEVVATGTNVKSLVQQKYDENNDILYVQLVGDWDDIKCDLGGGASAPMDPMLGCVVGSDNFPDIAIGRFSASSPTNVSVQVEKTITYEKDPSGSWYTKAIGVASNQGPGDDNELDYEQIDVIYDNKLEPFTYDGMSTAYDPSGTSGQVTSYIETGASIINYCGHGSMTSWGSTGFSNSDVNQLSNGDMLPFIFSVACVNGAFHSGECFAEAWLKKENGGAILTLMSTINQPWDPPMRGQDYFNDILTGGYDYNSNPGNGISTDEGRTTMGAVVANGLTLMLTESNGGSDLETVQTWTTFGDASLQFRTAAPAVLALSNTVMLVGTPYEATVTADGSPLAGAMVCLSQDGVYSSAYSDASGNFSIENNFLPGDVQIVVTGFNAGTIYDNIQCIPPTGPYVIFNAVEVNSASGMLEYGETSTLDFTVKNVGVAEATNVVVTISTSDTYVTITDGTEDFGTIAADEVKTIENAFEVEVAGDIPNGYSVTFQVVADGEEIWESAFSLTAISGVLEFINYTVDDSNGNNNGFLDPGETVDMTVTVENSGSADVYNVAALLTSSDPMLTVLTTEPQNVGDLVSGGQGQAVFSVSASPDIVPGYVGELTIGFTADLGLAQEDIIMIPFADYCEASTNTEDEWIANVACGDIDNASSWQGGVANYTDMTTTLEPGVGEPITIENGNAWASDIVTVWVDWNLDKELGNNANEIYELTNVGGSGQTFTGDITPPADQNAGQFRMRVRMTYSSAPEPCGESSYGEVEDYTVLVQGALTANFNADVTAGCEGMEVQFTDASPGATSWEWTFPGGTPGTSTEENPMVVYNSVGDYDVTLEVSDGSNTTSITKTEYIAVMDVPGQAGPIEGDQEVGVGETEDYMCAALDVCSLYEWILVPETAGEMVINMNEVTITWSSSWTGAATLKVCGGNDCGMGPYSEDFEVMVYDYTGIDEVTNTAIQIYPNPNNGQFTLNLSSTQATTYELKLVNALGMSVVNKTIEVNGNFSENVNISGFAEGIYYLYLRNDENSIIRKVVVQQ